MNILDLTEQDGLQLRRVASTGGGEWKGPCPWCGGTDRFSINPKKPNKNGTHRGGRYVCRQCGKSGDAIQYLRDRRGLSYPDACRALGYETGEPLRSRYTIPEKPKFEPRDRRTLGDLWRDKASSFLSWTQEQLWKDREAVAYLKGRGLSEDTIRGAGLGFNPKQFFRDRAAFGLEPENNPKTGKPKRVWLPIGWTIPNWTGGELSRIRFRRKDPDKDKYIYLPGSDTGPMVWDRERAVFVVVEAELDGLLIHQEAGDLVGVVALGAANYRPDKEAHLFLTGAELVLCALDSDGAGKKESWGFWRDTYGAERCPPIGAKDPTEMHQAGKHSIREWIQAALDYFGRVVPFPEDWLNRFNEEQLERLAIMTIDGGLTDEQALEALGLTQEGGL